MNQRSVNQRSLIKGSVNQRSLIKRSVNQRSLTVLALNESSLPDPYLTSTVTGREMRLVRDLPFVQRVIALGRSGTDYVEPGGGSPEPSIEVRHYLLLGGGKRGPLFAVVALYSALRLVLGGGVDVLHAESPVWTGPVAVLLGRIFRRPVLVEVRYHLRPLLDLHYRWLPAAVRRFIAGTLFGFSLRRADAVICNSRFHRDEAEALGVPAERLFVVSPGIRLTEALKAEVEAAAAKRSNVFTIAFAGRLEPGKAPSHVLLAAALAQKELGRVKVLVIGGGSEMAALQKLAADEGLDVEFAGQTNVRQWLPRAHVMVNSSLEAPALDVVNLEAYVAGLPVVAYGGNGLPETVHADGTGIIVSPGDRQGISNAIVTLARDPELRERYAAAGRRLVEESYLYERQVEAMRTAYEFALGPGPSGA